jgi:hypothetical protein
MKVDNGHNTTPATYDHMNNIICKSLYKLIRLHSINPIITRITSLKSG